MRSNICLATLAILFVASSAPARDLTVVNFGGANGAAQNSAFVEPFRKLGKQPVNTVEYNGEQARVREMIAAGRVIWDVVEVESADLGPGCEKGLYEKLDIGRIGNRADFLSEARHPCGMGIFVWSTVLAYHTGTVKNAPAGWQDFWNIAKYPGRRGMRKGARYNLEFALMADGIPASLVYGVLATPEGVDRAFRKLEQIKAHIRWWDAGAQPAQMLASGEVVMSTAYSGRIDSARREGKPLAITWSGSIFDLDYWAIPRGSSNRALAEQFIAFASTSAAQTAFAQNISYGPVNIQALANLDAKTLADLPTAPYNAKNAVQHDPQFWARQGESLENRFKKWLGQ